MASGSDNTPNGFSRTRPPGFRLLGLTILLSFFCVPLWGSQLALPEVTSISRTSSSSLTAPSTLSFAISVKPGQSAVSYLVVSLVTPSGATKSISFAAPLGNSVAVDISTDWQNGSYAVSQIFLQDAWGRQIIYALNGQVSVYGVSRSVTTAPAVHSLALSSLGFTVAGGVAQPTPPRFASLALQVGGTISAGGAARYAYSITPGTSPIARIMFTFIYGNSVLGYQSKLITVLSPATAGTVDFPVSAEMLNGPVRLQSAWITDAQSRLTSYSTTTLTDFDYSATSPVTPHQFNLNDLGFSVVGAQSTLVPPSLTAVISGSSRLSAGETLTLNYSASAGTSPVQSITFRIKSPYGGNLYLTGIGGMGSVSTLIGADWINGDYTVYATVSDALGQSSVGPPLPFTVSGAAGVGPGFITQPAANSLINEGSPVRLVSQAVGAEPPDSFGISGNVTYQWYVGMPGDVSRPAPGQTNSSYQFTATESGTYFVRATSAGQFTDSTAAVVTVIKKPVITQQPGNQSVSVGGTAIFSVAAVANNGVVSYTWRTNRGDFTTSQPTFTLSNVTASDAGYVYCMASNSAGAVSSEKAILNVKVSNLPLSITQDPSDAVSSIGNIRPVWFEAVAVGNPPLLYQWQKDGFDVQNGGSISGAQLATLSVGSNGPITEADAGAYRLKVTNGVETVYSRAANLTITHAPYVLGTSSGTGTTTEVLVGNYYSLSFGIIGDAPFNFQWRKDGVPIPGATSSILNLGPFTLADSGTYDLVVSNAFGTAISKSQKINVSTKPTAPVITRWPGDQSLTEGQSATFSVEAAGNNLAYQWYRNMNAIPGATSAALTIPAVTASSAGLYQIMVSNSVGQAWQLFTLQVLSRPLIAVQPVGQTVGIGTNVVISTQVFGGTPLQLQWRRNGVPLAEGPGIAGTQTDTLRLANVSAASSGTYDLTVTNTAGSAMSNSAVLTVVSAPTISTQPTDQTVFVGYNATFSVRASGLGTLSYLWQKNGTLIPGATSSDLVISAAQPADAGSYAVMITGNSGTVTSNTVRLTVTPVPAPQITVSPADTTVGFGENATLAVVAVGPSLAYQWSHNGVAIAGATNASLDLVRVQLTDAGSYSVTVRNSAGAVTSPPALISIKTTNTVGTYFGTFDGGRGAWALLVDVDRTGRLVGVVTATKLVITANIVLQPDGSFSGSALPVASNQQARELASDPHPVEAASQTYGVQGQITLAGAVTGQLEGGIGLSGTRDFTYGTASTSAGFYTATALNVASGVAYAVVGPSGKTFAVSSTVARTDYANGVTLTNGQMSALTNSGGQLTFTVSQQTHLVDFSLVPAGSTVPEQFLGLTQDVPFPSHLINLSVLTSLSSSEPSFTLGYVVGGLGTSGLTSLVLRAAGPSLSSLGVPDPLADPKFEIYAGSTKVAENDNWGGGSTLVSAMARVGAFAYSSPASKDAAAFIGVATRDNSIRISANDGGAGSVIAEIYDATPTASYTPTTPRLLNFSVLKQIGGSLTAGFVIRGSGPKTVLIRAVGPTLAAAPFNLGGMLADPMFTVFDTTGKVVGTNDNWGSTYAPGAATTAQLSSAFARVGAFGLSANSRDAALLVTLAPGTYTVRVGPATPGSGLCLVEIYDVQ